MMRLARYVLLGSFLLWISGCGQKGAKLQKSVVPPDKTLFETGQEYLSKSQYIKARLAFQTLISTYPDSELSADAYLAMGDSFYDEGGTENIIQAEDQYKNFIIFFPTHPKAADAQLKIISGNMRLMRSPDRDSTYSIKAEAAIKKFLEQFADSDFTPIVRQYQTEVEENLAQGDFGVGSFYYEKGNYIGAKSRFQEIVDQYRDFTGMDEALFRLADSLEKIKNPNEAAAYYAKIATGFPFSKRFEDAKDRLQKLGIPLPPVDTLLAAQNQAKLKPSEGFSPLKPFINFAEALGFKGPPDRYEYAKKAVETQKADAVAAAAASAARRRGQAG
jgi:outer membrane protein assembly factor BamD